MFSMTGLIRGPGAKNEYGEDLTAWEANLMAVLTDKRGTAPVVWGPGPQQPARGKARERSPHSGLKVSLPLAGGEGSSGV